MQAFMSRTLSYLAAAAAIGLVPVAAEAGFYSGDELYDSCTAEHSDKGYFEKTYECVAYISGAVDAFNTTREANNLKSCIPADVTIARLRDVTVDHLRRNPVDRKGSASKMVFAATRKAWPCKRRKRR